MAPLREWGRVRGDLLGPTRIFQCVLKGGDGQDRGVQLVGRDAIQGLNQILRCQTQRINNRKTGHLQSKMHSEQKLPRVLDIQPRSRVSELVVEAKTARTAMSDNGDNDGFKADFMTL